MNRTQIFKELRVTPTNERWSWCAKNTQNKIALFCIWENEEKIDGSWILYNPEISNKLRGLKDQKKLLDEAINKKFRVFGLVIVAKDPNVEVKKIESVKEDNLIELRLFEKEGRIFGMRIGEISLFSFLTRKNKKAFNNGINDLDLDIQENEFPDRAKITGYYFKRNPKIRKKVLSRAAGKCEYCEKNTFENEKGYFFLETHHIIKLASLGKDTMDNVIALCPNHHREAHFGKNADKLETEFIKIITAKSKKSKTQ